MFHLSRCPLVAFIYVEEGLRDEVLCYTGTKSLRNDQLPDERKRYKASYCHLVAAEVYTRNYLQCIPQNKKTDPGDELSHLLLL